MWKRMWPKEEKVEGVVEGEAGAAPLEAEVVAGGHLKERQHQSAKSNRRWVRNLGSTIYFQPHNTTWEILHVCSYSEHGSSSHVSFKDFSLSASSPMTNTSYRRKSFTHEEELHQWGRIAPVRKNLTKEKEFRGRVHYADEERVHFIQRILNRCFCIICQANSAAENDLPLAWLALEDRIWQVNRQGGLCPPEIFDLIRLLLWNSRC